MTVKQAYGLVFPDTIKQVICSVVLGVAIYTSWVAYQIYTEVPETEINQQR